MSSFQGNSSSVQGNAAVKSNEVPDIPMPDSGDNAGAAEKPSWMKKRTREEVKDQRVARRKRINVTIAKTAMPKTSIQALSEIATQLGVPLPEYENLTKLEYPGAGFQVDVMFQGVKHTGFGANSSKAKHAGCELHIRDFIRANLSKLVLGKKSDQDVEMSDGEPAKKPKVEEDRTPWACIYGFVMKKYLELMEIGDDALSSSQHQQEEQEFYPPAAPQAPSFGGYPGNASSGPHQDMFYGNSVMKSPTQPGVQPVPRPALLHARRAPLLPAPKAVPPPASLMAPRPVPPPAPQRAVQLPKKTVPANAPSMNPVMFLNEMHPEACYSTFIDSGAPGIARFKMSVTVNNETYDGYGQKVKEAKRAAAKRAVLALYGIECLGI